MEFTLKDLLKFLNMIEPIFNDLLVFTEKNYTYAQASFLYNIFSEFENNNLFECWKLKYLVFIIKIFKLFDVPILQNHNINKYWMNKYNFEQRRYFIEYDLNDCGTFEKWGLVLYFIIKMLLKMMKD